jgi:LPXTG-motif cell wall-anchored protein
MNDDRLLLGLVGAGIQGSLSPRMHEAEARHHGLRLHYQPIDLDTTGYPVGQLPKLIEGIYGIKAPKTPRNDLVEIFLTGIAKNAPTLDGSKAPIQADLNSQVLNQDVKAKSFQPSEMLRLNTAVAPAANPNRLGVLGGDLQGFPNGRRLTDDVVDIAVQAVEGAAVSGIVPALAAGDKVNANDHTFGGSFPYLALPNTSAVNLAASSKAMTSGSTAGAAMTSSDSGSGDGQLLGAELTSVKTGGSPMSAPVAGGAALATAFIGGGLFLALRRRRTGRVSIPA